MPTDINTPEGRKALLELCESIPKRRSVEWFADHAMLFNQLCTALPAALAKIAELEAALRKSKCCDPLAPLATCAYCKGTVHTCERKEPVNNDYRCPAHPDDRQDGDKWFCSESCQQQFTIDALTDQLVALRAASQWRDIETAPKDGTEFTGGWSSEGLSHYATGTPMCWQNGRTRQGWFMLSPTYENDYGEFFPGKWIGKWINERDAPTHWRPLLEPPARAAAESKDRSSDHSTDQPSDERPDPPR